VRQLPSHHVPRPRLITLLEEARVGLVEAGAGYGKSSLAEELAAHLGATPIVVVFEPRDEAVGLFAARLAGGLRGAGLAPAAEAIVAPDAEPADAVEAFLAALRLQAAPVLLVLDDAHHCSGDAARHLVRLTAGVPAPHRAVVLARALPRGAADLRRVPGAVALDGRDLSLTAPEVGELLRAGHGVELSPRDAAWLTQATGGWAAAVVLASARLARSADIAADVEAIAAQPTVLAYLLQELLAELDEKVRAAVVQLAHLPLLAPATATAIGVPGAFERAAALGLPLMPARDGWFELPGPVREYLTVLAPLERQVARAAARLYVERAEVLVALRVLLASGDTGETAALLGTLPSRLVEALDFVEVRAVVEALPEAAVRAHPRVLLKLARAAQFTDQAGVRSAALEWARAVATEGGDERLGRELDAEISCDLVRDGLHEPAEKLARAVLAASGGDETLTRARALETVGTVLAARHDARSLAEAEPLWEEAARLTAEAGETTWASSLLALLGYYVVYPAGRHEQALRWIDEALVLAAARRPRAFGLVCRAEVLVNWGRYAEAEEAIAEACELATSLRDHRLVAYALWERARMASQRGDAAATAGLVREVEGLGGAWYETVTGLEFLADAADILDRVGEIGPSREFLERAGARRSEGPAFVLVAEAAVEARAGDPQRVPALVNAALATAVVPPRERWRLLLLRAYAAWRSGSSEAAGLAAHAFEAAAGLGTPSLPMTRERDMSSRLLALAVEAGSRAAAQLDTGDRTATVSVLGRFEVTAGTERIDLPEGKPEQLVKLLAAAGGRLHAEEAIEALWPEVEPDSGRKRLRNTLSRLRASTRELVIRDGDVLALAPGVEVDSVRFEDDARRALAAGIAREQAPLARAALARYGGELLPDDRYEPWAAAPRERLRGHFLALLDRLAADSERRGEPDDALRLLERAIEADPYESERYLRAARLLLAQDRRVAATRMLQRARAVLEHLRLPLPPALLELAGKLREPAPGPDERDDERGTIDGPPRDLLS
jgi:DNA-binding SARP family transcriptional activator